MTESRIKSADDLIVAVEREQLGKLPMQPVQKAEAEIQAFETESPFVQEEKQASEEPQEVQKEEVQEKKLQQKESDKETSNEQSSDDNVDEYGNTIAKERTFTQAEVQEMIRKRVATIKNAETPVQPQQQPQQPAEETEDWQQQLKSEIKNTVNEIKQQEQEQAWREQQASEQSAYEEKFTQGMVKYNDFESVVTGKPITSSMMMATKGMQDPAAFVYAACKNAPDELNRIAKIADPHIQIAEMARLEERMKKPRVVTNAPKPSRKISGDASSEMPKHSIDSLIATHAREKIVHTRRLK